MRAYFFGNMYLSSIQQGIQAKHCGDEMVVKYAPSLSPGTEPEDTQDEKYRVLLDYLKNHKTVICLNAGYSSTLHEIFKKFEDSENPYPFAKFHESEEALDCALTCVGIVVPESIYETALEVRNSRGRNGIAKIHDFNDFGDWTTEDEVPIHYKFTKFQVCLINEMNKYGLAK